MQGGAAGRSAHDPELDKAYLRALDALERDGVAFLVGGAYAMEHYTGIVRRTKDIDVFIKPADCRHALDVLARAGFRTELTFPHWLGKALLGGAVIDVIFRSGNGLAEVDQDWLDHGVEGEAVGRRVRLCPPEEIIWQKAYIKERERYDGADVDHLLLRLGPDLDWPWLLRRFGEHWRVLLSHLILFGFVYPSERARIPDWVVRELLGRLQDELARPAPPERLCQGTLLSRAQYLFDLEQGGFQDARLAPRGKMTPNQVTSWTDAIDKKILPTNL